MNLTPAEKMLLQAIRSALRGEQAAWSREIPTERWAEMLDLAAAHKLLPMVYEAVYDCPAADTMPECRQTVLRQVTVQTVRSQEAMQLYRTMTDQGLKPLIVKGMLCRSLYPKPDHRLSGDEDLLVRPEELEKTCAALEEFGMKPQSRQSYEISWRMEGSPLHIELHRSLFDTSSQAYGTLESFFEYAHDQAHPYTMPGGQIVYSLSPHAHMLYLLLHAFKHFVHSGFGIRQVCDIGLWAGAYRQDIDWEELYSQCARAGALHFSAAVLQIVQKHLKLSLTLPKMWYGIKTDPDPMLMDLLRAGVYGSMDGSRIHSATITLGAVEQRKLGILDAVFPRREVMTRKFPILQRHPYLLPVTWGVRLARYGVETVTHRDNNAMQSLRVAKERTRLLRYYHIIR